MFGLFSSSRPPVDADEFDWLVACLAWLLDVLDGGDPASLRAHGGAFDPAAVFDGIDRGLRGHDLAEALFGRVKALCGVADWPCRLVEGERRREARLQAGLALKHDRHAPLGLFTADRSGVVIAYDPALTATPDRLVATFAHELAHYLLAGKGAPPGGPELIEHATDCAAVYLGFGPFLANAALSFRQFSSVDESGWEMQAAGYLSEPALTTATALAVHVAGGDPGSVEPLLKRHLRGPFRRASRAAARRLPGRAESLRQVDRSAWA